MYTSELFDILGPFYFPHFFLIRNYIFPYEPRSWYSTTLIIWEPVHYVDLALMSVGMSEQMRK